MSYDKKPDLLDWLGFRWKPDYSKARWLGPFLTAVFILFVLFLVVPTVLEFFRAVTGLDNFGSEEAQSVAIRNTGLVLAAVIGVPFIVWRSLVAQKQVNVAEQGQITDRINKAVELLGNDEASVRMGAILSFDRIMADSPTDRVMVLTMLNAYISHHQPADTKEAKPQVQETKIDVQAALDVLFKWRT